MGTQSHSTNERVEVLRERFRALGQEHVFRFWDRLDPEARQMLARQAESLDLPTLLRALETARTDESSSPAKLDALQVESLPGRGGDPAAWERARSRGEALLAEGRVAALVVAGGQATRLGFAGPKGLYPIGPVTDRSLFEIQAQKLRRLREASGIALPWYVMTSPATDAPTREFLATHDRFGLPADDVVCFSQGMVPSFDLDDRLMLAEPGRIMENPDGHGGCLTALLASGALDDMERRGVTTIFYYQVDNPLVRMADPAFLGFHAEAGAEVSCKAVRKVDPFEKVGILALRDGAPGVVEYSELDDEQAQARDASGELIYGAGNVAIHCFETAFVRRVASEPERWLPFHVAKKKIASVDAAGQPFEPDAPNGQKLERFIFDALPAARAFCVVEAERESEFAPVKNATGVDSPDTSRSALVAQYTRWIEAAGLEVPPGSKLEIDHSRIDSADDARRLALPSLQGAGDIVRIAPGADA